MTLPSFDSFSLNSIYLSMIVLNVNFRPASQIPSGLVRCERGNFV